MADYDTFGDHWSSDFDTDPWGTDDLEEPSGTGRSTDEGRWTENALRIPLPDEKPPLCLNIRVEDIRYVGALVGLIVATAMLGVGLVMLLYFRTCQLPVEQSDEASHARNLGNCFRPATAESVLTFLLILVGFVVDVLGIVPFVVYTCMYRKNHLTRLRMRALYDAFSLKPAGTERVHENSDEQTDADADADTRWQTSDRNYITMDTFRKSENVPFIGATREPDFDM